MIQVPAEGSFAHSRIGFSGNSDGIEAKFIALSDASRDWENFAQPRAQMLTLEAEEHKISKPTPRQVAQMM